MIASRILWTCWALVPVGVLAFHFGPGQRAAVRDEAAGLRADAIAAERAAAAAQEKAYAAHLAAIEARRTAFLSQASEDAERARAAARAEDEAYREASAAWKKTAGAFAQIEAVLAGAPSADLSRIRWGKSRAMVRSGEIGRGVDELEDLLDEFAARDRARASESARNGRRGATGVDDRAEVKAEHELARSTREELATAYYYGARLMRLAGKPAEDWLAISGKSRQQFRYLAEAARDAKESPQRVQDYERNLELVLNLEQNSLGELQAHPLPRESPRTGADGLRPGDRPGKNPRPPRRRDARGAGGNDDIGPGW